MFSQESEGKKWCIIKHWATPCKHAHCALHSVQTWLAIIPVPHEECLINFKMFHGVVPSVTNTSKSTSHGTLNKLHSMSTWTSFDIRSYTVTKFYAKESGKWLHCIISNLPILTEQCKTLAPRVPKYPWQGQIPHTFKTFHLIEQYTASGSQISSFYIFVTFMFRKLLSSIRTQSFPKNLKEKMIYYWKLGRSINSVQCPMKSFLTSKCFTELSRLWQIRLKVHHKVLHL